MKNIPLIVALLALAGCGGSNGIDSFNSATGVSTTALAAPTAVTLAPVVDSGQFLIEAYRDGLSEIQLAQIALQRSANNDVRNFAQRMIDQHTRVNSEITPVAQGKNIALPTTVSAEQSAEAIRLGALSGDEFDRAYMAANVAAHEKDVTAAKQQALEGNDENVRLIADLALPILETHQAIAEEILYRLDPSAFLVGVYQDGLGEIQLSQLALQKAVDADVRRYAQRMIDDHTRVNARIATIAQQRNVSLPTAVKPSQQLATNGLARFSGADFDKTYVDKNVIHHLKGAWYGGRQASEGRDLTVRVFALETVPVIGGHLATAIELTRRLKATPLYAAYQDGKAEILFARLALTQGAATQVKEYAQRMITDHTAVNTQIAQLAQQKSVALPAEMAPEQRAAFIDLLGRSGADFDKQYIDANVKGHQNDVAELNGLVDTSTDADIRTFAQNVLPTLRAHLVQAEQIKQQLTTSVQP